MSLNRRLNALLTSAAPSPAALRRARPAAVALGLAAALAACSGGSDDEDAATGGRSGPPPGQGLIQDDPVRDIPVTQLFEQAGGGRAIGFLPDSETVWAGNFISTVRDGGMDLYNSDGEIIANTSGPRLNGLATAPNFALRGVPLPLVVSVNEASNRVRAYALSRQEETPNLFDLPLAPINIEGGAASVCVYEEGPGYVDIVVVGVLARAGIWRISDTGGELVDATPRASFTLEAPARACAAADGDIIFASPSAGLSRMNAAGEVLAERADPVVNLAYGDFFGTHRLLVTTGTNPIQLYDPQTLEPLEQIELVTALSATGVENPGPLAVSRENFGGVYRTGVLIVEDNGVLKAVARDAFARELLAPEADAAETR
jgi:hypothetical protein